MPHYSFVSSMAYRRTQKRRKEILILSKQLLISRQITILIMLFITASSGFRPKIKVVAKVILAQMPSKKASKPPPKLDSLFYFQDIRKYPRDFQSHLKSFRLSFVWPDVLEKDKIMALSFLILPKLNQRN